MHKQISSQQLTATFSLTDAHYYPASLKNGIPHLGDFKPTFAVDLNPDCDGVVTIHCCPKQPVLDSSGLGNLKLKLSCGFWPRWFYS
jgi:hypothetical protein